jgi:hypothetical protein
MYNYLISHAVAFWTAIRPFVDSYHDILILIIQLLCIAPFTAAFIEIRRKRDRIAVRTSSILWMNAQIVTLHVEIGKALCDLEVLSIYETIADSRTGVKELLLASNGEESDLREHNARVEEHLKGFRKHIGRAIHSFQLTEKTCDRIHSNLILFASTFDVDEFERVTDLAKAIEITGLTANRFIFFIQEVMAGLKPTKPEVLNYSIFLDLWDRYIDEMGSPKSKSFLVRNIGTIGRKLGLGDFFGSLPPDIKQRIKNITIGLRKEGHLTPAAQEKVIAILHDTDFSVLNQARIDVPLASPQN